ncbi:MAG: nucleotidyltransferase family protein [Bacilli bacterium]
MDIIGIICEYNPFHNGHLYHLEKIKEMFPNSLIVLVMPSSFTQRGNASIINKWDKTRIALNYKIDLVIELPYVFTVQSATYFAKASVAILNHLKIDYLVFGSECGSIDILKTKDNEKLLPNDMLGKCYLNEILNNNYNMIPITIKRTNDYHNTLLNDTITSATSIRNGLKEHKDISKYTPIDIKYINTDFLDDNYFKYLKYKIISEQNDLKKYLDVDEGLENRILKYIYKVTTIDELIMKIKTKRYTYSKLSRMLNHILCGFMKEERDKFCEITYIRVLGFSKLGQSYLKKIKKEVTIPIITNYSKIHDSMLDYEMTITKIYASVLNNQQQQELIENEYKNNPLNIL